VFTEAIGCLYIVLAIGCLYILCAMVFAYILFAIGFTGAIVCASILCLLAMVGCGGCVRISFLLLGGGGRLSFWLLCGLCAKQMLSPIELLSLRCVRS
jgi:hypothetical protein